MFKISENWERSSFVLSWQSERERWKGKEGMWNSEEKGERKMRENGANVKHHLDTTTEGEMRH